MTLKRPTAEVTVDGQALAMPEAAIAALRIDLGLGAAHDRAQLALWPGSRFKDIAIGAEASVALGYGDDRSDVLAGTVEAIDATAAGLVVEILSRTAALSRAVAAQAYVQQSVADIVQDLVQNAGGQTGEVDADAQLSIYHVDERRPVWAHLLELARLASCDLCGDAEGKVCVRPPRTGNADKQLRRGAELVAWQVGRRAAPPDPAPVVPYGAASENGSAAWHLVLRQPDGEQPAGPSLVHPAVRDRDLARALDRGRSATRDRRAVGGTVHIVGDAGLRPGALVELVDVPGGLGTLRTTAVRHLITAHAGFTTQLALEVSA